MVCVGCMQTFDRSIRTFVKFMCLASQSTFVVGAWYVYVHVVYSQHGLIRHYYCMSMFTIIIVSFIVCLQAFQRCSALLAAHVHLACMAKVGVFFVAIATNSNFRVSRLHSTSDQVLSHSYSFQHLSQRPCLPSKLCVQMQVQVGIAIRLLPFHFQAEHYVF